MSLLLALISHVTVQEPASSGGGSIKKGFYRQEFEYVDVDKLNRLLKEDENLLMLIKTFVERLD